MKSNLLLICCVLGHLSLFAQAERTPLKQRPLNGISLNFFGDASMVSINYERLFKLNSTLLLTSRLGIGETQEDGFELICFDEHHCNEDKLATRRTIPHHITVCFGKRKRFFELGLGGTAYKVQNWDYVFYPIVGYRVQPLRSKRVNFRVYGEFPFFSSDNWGPANKDIVFIPIGISAGFYF